MIIAVTGASGFIGTELLAELNKRDDVSVIALTRDASGKESSGRCEWRSTDYSYESLKDIFRGYGVDGSLENPGVDAVIHLAGVRGTEKDPEKFAVNLRMTDNVLRAMTVSSAKRIVFASTVSVYDDEKLMPWTEEAPLKGRSCYGDSKAECEALIQSYEEAFRKTGAPLTYGIARIAQVLGEGERRRGMMNVFIDTAREHGTLKVMGKSAAKKQYIYVKDLARILTVLACGNESFAAEEDIIVNAGMPNAYTNLEIAEIVNKVFENDTPIDYDDSYPETGRAFFMNTSRLRERLGIEPLDMEAAIRDMKELQNREP